MEIAERNKIAERQDKESEYLAEKWRQYEEAEDKFRSYFLEIDKKGDSLFDNLPERKSEIFSEIINLYLNDQTQYKSKLEEINKKYPQFNSSEFKNAMNDMWVKQTEYYKELVNYLNVMDNDYKTLFSDSYKNKIFDMAKNGLFVFYEQTPDLEDFLVDDTDKNIRLVLDYLAIDNFGPLLQMLSAIFAEEDPNDFLRTIKTRELKEAVACLINNCYGSCARTMLALIENEHNNASNINRDFFSDRITKGADRSIEISEQLGQINIAYFSECWKLMDDFYREITLNSNKKSKRFINRNEVVHGVYWDAILPNRDSCTELILFYISFKRISYFLQQVYDMKTNMNELIIATLARKAKDNV